MCGRFYVDDDTAREIERTIRKVDEQLKKELRKGDIHPTEKAMVISVAKDAVNQSMVRPITPLSMSGEIAVDTKKWGFPGFGTQQVIFNARAESVLEKKLFRESVLKRRIIIPATGFYEWNKKKEKVTFTSGEAGVSILYMAGFYQRFEDGDRFVILTTSANESMQDVHDCMPLLLEPDDLEEWLWVNRKLEKLLNKVPMALERRMEYEQQELRF